MQLYRVEFGILVVKLENLFRSGYRINAGHENVAFVEIKAQLLNGLLRDCGVNLLSIEFSDRAKPYWFEIPFLLSLLKRIFEDDVSIERFTILPERSSRELQNPTAIEAFLE